MPDRNCLTAETQSARSSLSEALRASCPRLCGEKSHRPTIVTAIIAALLSLTVGCSPQPPAGEPGVLFQDDFSQTTSGWDAHRDSSITTDYEEGRYVLALADPGQNIWSLAKLDLTDLALSVETAYAEGPVNNEYGMMCRYSRSGDKHSFYFFFISSDGFYALGKVVKNQRTILNPATGDFQPSDAIKQGQTDVNQLTATCQGQQMSLAVNGATVGAFEDDELTHGDIGLLIGAYDEGGVKIAFDNLVVRKP